MVIRTRTPLRLTFDQFSATDYPGLNGLKPLAAAKLDIERSLLMVGYPSAKSAIALVGPWRATLLSALVEGYLTHDLRTSAYFQALEPSERLSMTFLLAQAFTHWMADAHLSVPILLHVTGATPSWTLAPLPGTPKSGAGLMKSKSRPDFIGIAPSAYHVFESKGRSLPSNSTSAATTVAAGCMKQALAQVSRIATVNGAAPRTRTATVWVLRGTGARGYITDPPARRDSLDLKFDLREALIQYYRIVLDAAASLERRDGPRLVRYRLSDRRTLLVDRKLVGLLVALENDLARPEEVLELLKRREKAYGRARRLPREVRRVAFGLDGVGLLVSGEDKDASGRSSKLGNR